MLPTLVNSGMSMLYTWQNPFVERVLHWECGMHGYGFNNLTRDGLGDFSVEPNTRPHFWVSFLNGRQRFLLFTEDLYEAVRAKEIGELERNIIDVRRRLKIMIMMKLPS